MNMDEPYRGRVKIRYGYRKYDKKYATKKRGYIAPRDIIMTRNFITAVGFPDIIQR